MWQMIKDDPILKTVTILILGVLGFGFAFNIMFGQRAAGSMEDGGEMASGRYALDGTLSYILVIALKLLLITAVIIAIVAMVKLAKKYLFKGEEIKIMNSIKNDPVLKTVLIIAVSIIVLLLTVTLFSGIMSVNNSGMNGFGMNGYIMVGNGMQSTSLAGILAILLKVLLFVSVIGLVIGIGVFLYQNYANSITRTKQFCESCGAELKAEWKCCPGCGKERELQD